MCAECWEYLIVQMEYPTVVWNFKAFPIKSYIPFLKDACAFVLPFGSSAVLTGLHSKEKCTCDQLFNGCVQMGVFLLVDV